MPFWKSTKLTFNYDWKSKDASMMDLKIDMWSLHDLCGLKLACSYLSCVSVGFFHRVFSTSMLQNSIPGVDSSVFQRQLLHLKGRLSYVV